MSDMFLLSEEQMSRISPFFPLAHGVPRVYDRRVISGIVYVIRYGLQWKDAPKEYGPHKTLYNRFIRWSRLGVFDRIFAALAGEGDPPPMNWSTLMYVFGQEKEDGYAQEKTDAGRNCRKATTGRYSCFTGEKRG